MDWRDHIARYGRVRLPGRRWMRITFLGLLVLAAILRFWDLPDLPYTHDEISALVRIYPTLGETIQKGVIELDTHPPGVQVFEWIWTKLFSMEESDVKLPFILMSLAALFLLYRFALAWTGAAPALLLTALMATLQYSVMYGQIARPYAAGLFTTALFADQLTRFLAFGHRKALVGIGIAAFLSAYTHHFSLLLTGIMGLTGMFLVKPTQRKAYLIMCGIVVLLYLPNVPIVLKQLGLGGLQEWLQAPGPDWISDYAWWIAHCSVPFAVILVSLVAVAAVLHIRNGGAKGPIIAILLGWGLLPLLIGMAYSIWRAPVIQYSVLLFSFPYIALALLCGLRRLKQWTTVALCALLAFASVRTLISTRHHYELFYASKYEAMIRQGQQAIADNGRDGSLVIFDAPDHIIRFYFDLWRIDVNSFPYAQLRDGLNTSRLDSLLRTSPGRVVAYGHSNASQPENVARIQQYFPFLLERHDMVEGQTFLFADRRTGPLRYDRDTMAYATPDARSGVWGIPMDLSVAKDTMGHATAWEYSGREFGADISFALDTAADDPLEQVEVIADVDYLNELTDAVIIADVKAGDSTVFYRGGELRTHGKGDASLIVAVHQADAGPVSRPVMKTYVYNKNKGGLHVKRITVLRRSANPVVYGMFEPVPWMGRFR